MVTKTLGELWKKLFFCKKNALFAKFWPFSPKISFWHSLNGDDFFFTWPCCDIKISKPPYVPFSKMFGLCHFFITFRSARKKLHVTVFFDHPVALLFLLQKGDSEHGSMQRWLWRWPHEWKPGYLLPSPPFSRLWASLVGRQGAVAILSTLGCSCRCK